MFTRSWTGTITRITTTKDGFFGLVTEGVPDPLGFRVEVVPLATGHPSTKRGHHVDWCIEPELVRVIGVPDISRVNSTSTRRCACRTLMPVSIITGARVEQ